MRLILIINADSELLIKYAVSPSSRDSFNTELKLLMIFFGALGYVMKKFNFPVAPLMMGYILGGLLETSLIQALILSGGSVVPVFTRPISLLFVVLTVFFIVWSLFIQKKALERRKRKEEQRLDS